MARPMEPLVVEVWWLYFFGVSNYCTAITGGPIVVIVSPTTAVESMSPMTAVESM